MGTSASTLQMERKAFTHRLCSILELKQADALRPTRLSKAFNDRSNQKPISHTAAYKWLNGQSIPSQEKLVILAEWLGIAAHWLRFGEGPLNIQPVQLAMTNEGPDPRLILGQVKMLPLRERQLVRDFIQLLKSRSTADPASARDDLEVEKVTVGTTP